MSLLWKNNELGSIKLGKVSEGIFKESCNDMLILGVIIASCQTLQASFLENSHSRDSGNVCGMEISYVEGADANKQKFYLMTHISFLQLTIARYMVYTSCFISTSWHLLTLSLVLRIFGSSRSNHICLLECLDEWV